MEKLCYMVGKLLEGMTVKELQSGNFVFAQACDSSYMGGLNKLNKRIEELEKSGYIARGNCRSISEGDTVTFCQLLVKY